MGAGSWTSTRQLERHRQYREPRKRGVRATLAQTYRLLGEYEMAEPHALRLLELCEAENPDDLNAQLARVELGNLRRGQGRHQEAIGLLTGARTALIELVGEHAPETLDATEMLAYAHSDSGAYPIAEDLYRGVLASRLPP